MFANRRGRCAAGFKGVLLMGLLTGLTAAAAAATTLQVGDQAPAFSLLDQNGERRRLADYQGGWLVLYFYPKDDTPGCTTEACQFRDDVPQFKAMGVSVVGVSLDDVGSHKAFAEKYHLPFPLLADTDAQVAEAYGVVMKLVFWKLAKRQTFVIGPDGKIAKIYREVTPKSHSDRVIADLQALGVGADTVEG